MVTLQNNNILDLVQTTYVCILMCSVFIAVPLGKLELRKKLVLS